MNDYGMIRVLKILCPNIPSLGALYVVMSNQATLKQRAVTYNEFFRRYKLLFLTKKLKDHPFVFCLQKNLLSGKGIF